MPSIDGHSRRTAPSLTLKIPQDFSKNSNLAKSEVITSAPPVCPLFTTKNTELVVNPIFTSKTLDVIQNAGNPRFRQRSVSFPVELAPSHSASPASLKKLSQDNSCCDKKALSVDYQVPDPSRPLEIKVSGRHLYVNPKFVHDAAPLFTSSLVKELIEGKRKSMEIHLEDLSFDEFLEMVKAICPTELGIYPTPVTSKTFLLLAKLSQELKVQKLKQACERFIAQLPFTAKEVSATELMEFLHACCKYDLSRSSKIRLLEGIIGILTLPQEEISDKLPQPLKLVIRALYNESIKGRLSHAELSNTAKLKVPCRVCRTSNTNLPPPTVVIDGERNFIPVVNDFVVCSRCRHTICQDCAMKPCPKTIEEFLVKFIEK